MAIIRFAQGLERSCKIDYQPTSFIFSVAARRTSKVDNGEDCCRSGYGYEVFEKYSQKMRLACASDSPHLK